MSDKIGTKLESGTDRVLHRLERIYADLDARLERLVELTRAKAPDAMREPRPTTGIGHEGCTTPTNSQDITCTGTSPSLALDSSCAWRSIPAATNAPSLKATEECTAKYTP